MATTWSRILAALFTLLLIGAIAVPGAVAGASESEGDLTLAVTQDSETGNATVTLTDNGTAVPNATVTVAEVTGNYSDTGTFETDENGTVGLAEPTETVTVSVNATTNESSIEGEFELVPRADSLSVDVTQDADGVTVTVEQYDSPVENATVNVTTVDENETYAGTGEYLTDENGTVGLETPDLPVEITVVATHDDLSAETTAALDGSQLDIALVQHDDYTATVTVTRGDTPIENATVEIWSDDGYAGNGTYTTDADGNVSLVAPEDPVNITVNATADSLTAEETFALDSPELDLSVSQNDDFEVIIEVLYGGDAAEGASVDVTGDYTYAGSYVTDANGTVVLNPPANDTTINVTAAYQNETASATNVAIQAVNDSNPNNDFAEALVTFIDFLRGSDLAGPPGQHISAFVHEHNPASADDDAGPPEHAGPKGNQTAAQNDTEENGPPSWAGPGNETDTAENETGPPEHAGPPENKTESADGGSNGQGSSNGNGNGNGNAGGNGSGNGNK